MSAEGDSPSPLAVVTSNGEIVPLHRAPDGGYISDPVKKGGTVLFALFDDAPAVFFDGAASAKGAGR